ncbi:uncharacterized protein [Periplaneta americana]|uniref:uncharacterized protein n=1 Tax=Periplaneta americana TaxID=6978 RepID=UPI0037E99835
MGWLTQMFVAFIGVCIITCQIEGDFNAERSRPTTSGSNLELTKSEQQQKDVKPLIVGEFRFISKDGTSQYLLAASDDGGDLKVLSVKNSSDVPRSSGVLDKYQNQPPGQEDVIRLSEPNRVGRTANPRGFDQEYNSESRSQEDSHVRQSRQNREGYRYENPNNSVRGGSRDKSYDFEGNVYATKNYNTANNFREYERGQSNNRGGTRECNCNRDQAEDTRGSFQGQQSFSNQFRGNTYSEQRNINRGGFQRTNEGPSRTKLPIPVYGTPNIGAPQTRPSENRLTQFSGQGRSEEVPRGNNRPSFQSEFNQRTYLPPTRPSSPPQFNNRPAPPPPPPLKQRPLPPPPPPFKQRPLPPPPPQFYQRPSPPPQFYQRPSPPPQFNDRPSPPPQFNQRPSPPPQFSQGPYEPPGQPQALPNDRDFVGQPEFSPRRPDEGQFDGFVQGQQDVSSDTRFDGGFSQESEFRQHSDRVSSGQVSQGSQSGQIVPQERNYPIGLRIFVKPGPSLAERFLGTKLPGEQRTEDEGFTVVGDVDIPYNTSNSYVDAGLYSVNTYSRTVADFFEN